MHHQPAQRLVTVPRQKMKCIQPQTLTCGIFVCLLSWVLKEESLRVRVAASKSLAGVAGFIPVTLPLHQVKGK